MSKVERVTQRLSDLPARSLCRIPGVRGFMVRTYLNECSDYLKLAEKETPNRRAMLEDRAHSSWRRAVIAEFGHNLSKTLFPDSFKS